MRAVSPLQQHASSPVRSPQSPGSRAHSMYEYRGGKLTNQNTAPGHVTNDQPMTGQDRSGPASMPGPGSSYMPSPRNYQTAPRRESHDQYNTNAAPSGGQPRQYSAGFTDSGTHSLPFALHNNYNDATLYQVSRAEEMNNKRLMEMSLAGGFAQSRRSCA